MKNTALKKTVLSGMLLAVGLVLPLLTGQVPLIGKMLLPMHLPVFLCGLILGPYFGLAVGIILPLLRSVLFSVPVLYPAAIAMALELSVYGFISGYMYEKSKWKCVVSLYRAIISAMLTGRIVWGAAQVVLLGIKGGTFTWNMFFAGAFINALPGIALQLILIPAIMIALDKSKLVRFSKTNEAPAEAK